MGFFARLRRKVSAVRPVVTRAEKRRPSHQDEENRLRATLKADPNDEAAFVALAEIVRERAVEGHEVEGGDPQRAANDAVWALAEELAQSPRAWFPLIELARLSIDDDRDGALRRLATAAERESTGRALAEGLAMLRQAGHADDALGLGVGHWRPAEHDVEIGKHLVAAAVETGRMAEARRHLEAMSHHPDKGKVAPLQIDLQRYISEEDAKRVGH